MNPSPTTASSTTNVIPNNDIQALPFTATIPSKSEPSFFQKLWQKVCDVAVSIFKAIANFFGRRDFFSKRDIKLMRDEGQSPAPLTSPSPPLSTRNTTIEKPAEIGAQTKKQPVSNPEPVYRNFDAPLEGLRAYARDFATLGINVFYDDTKFLDRSIADHVEYIKGLLPEIQPMLKSIAAFSVEVGDKATKPIFTKIKAEKKSQIIDPTLRMIFNTLTKPDHNKLRDSLEKHLKGWLAGKVAEKAGDALDYITPILNWVSTPEEHRKPLAEIYSDKKFDEELVSLFSAAAQAQWNIEVRNEREDLKASLTNKLLMKFKDVQVPSGQTIITYYIDPILKSIFDTNSSEPLKTEANNVEDAIFEKAITLLVEDKIDQYSKYLQATVQNTLDTIVKETMQKNATRITNFLTERASELISNVQFTETLDSLIEGTLDKQIQAIIASEEMVEKHKKLIEDAEKVVKMPPEKVSKDQIEEAKNYLKSVNAYESKEAFLHYKRLLAFSKEVGCHPQLKKIIDQENQLASKGQNPEAYSKISESAIYSDIADKLVNLMAPERQKLGENGKMETMDTFDELWDLLYFPEEFHKVIAHSKELTDEFITPENLALLESMGEGAIGFAKNSFKSIAKDMFKKQIGKLVQNVVEKLITPASLDEINADSSLPNINLILVETFAKQELARNLNQCAPEFLKLVTLQSDVQEHQMQVIKEQLIALAKSKFKQFNPDEFYSKETGDVQSPEMVLSGLSDDDWKKIANSIVVEVKDGILQSKVNGVPFVPKDTTLAEIKDILKVIFSSTSKANNPFFGELANDAIFRLGELENGEWLISTFLQDTISRSITEAVAPWRESHDKLVNVTTEALRRNYSDRKSVKELLIDEAKKPSGLTEKKLAHQINVMARLSHDLIMGLAQESGMIATFATKRIISDNPDKLNKVIANVYRKLFADRLISENLVVQACYKIHQSLLEASDKVKMDESTHVSHLAQLASRYQVSDVTMHSLV